MDHNFGGTRVFSMKTENGPAFLLTNADAALTPSPKTGVSVIERIDAIDALLGVA